MIGGRRDSQRRMEIAANVPSRPRARARPRPRPASARLPLSGHEGAREVRVADDEVAKMRETSARAPHHPARQGPAAVPSSQGGQQHDHDSTTGARSVQVTPGCLCLSSNINIPSSTSPGSRKGRLLHVATAMHAMRHPQPRTSASSPAGVLSPGHPEGALRTRDGRASHPTMLGGGCARVGCRPHSFPPTPSCPSACPFIAPTLLLARTG